MSNNGWHLLWLLTAVCKFCLGVRWIVCNGAHNHFLSVGLYIAQLISFLFCLVHLLWYCSLSVFQTEIIARFHASLKISNQPIFLCIEYKKNVVIVYYTHTFLFFSSNSQANWSVFFSSNSEYCCSQLMEWIYIR